jgi:succinoglycan biosynthesis transport protein ExoP
MAMNTKSEDLSLQQYWQVLKRRWLPASGAFVLVSGLFALSTLMDDPVYRAEGSLLIKSSRAPSLTGLDQDLGNLDPLTYRGNPIETQTQIIESATIAQAVIQDLELKNEDGKPWSPATLLKSLDVSSVSETADVLSVQFRTNDPELAADIVNQVMDEYVAFNLQDNRAEASSAREFIETQLPRAEADMRRAANSLRQFKESNQVVTLEAEAVAVVDILKDIDQRILAAQAQLADVSEKSAELSSQLGMDARGSVLSASLGQTPGIEELLIELQQVQSQLALEKTRYRDIHPTVTGLERQEAALTNLLQQRVSQVAGAGNPIQAQQIQFGELRQNLTQDLVTLETQRLGLAQQLEQLNRSKDAYQARASLFPELEETQNLLQRRLDDAIRNYEDLLSRLQAVQIAENQNLGNAQVIQEAIIPSSPVSNNAGLVRLAGLICGLLMGVAVAFILDLLDRSIQTVQDAQAILRYPLLGQIPDISTRNRERLGEFASSGHYGQVPVLENVYSPFSKAYQMLQANIKGLEADTLVITSSTFGEGTSTVVANLAATFTQSSRRVLIIDANVANPRQHEIWGVSNASGLSELLQTSANSKIGAWKDTVAQITPNLAVLPAGKTPINSTGAFDSETMQDLLANARSIYDLVILDTAPMSTCPDAVILERFAGGLVLVVNPRKANIDDLEATRELFVHPTSRVLGFVANQVRENQRLGSTPHTLLQSSERTAKPLVFQKSESVGKANS